MLLVACNTHTYKHMHKPSTAITPSEHAYGIDLMLFHHWNLLKASLVILIKFPVSLMVLMEVNQISN